MKCYLDYNASAPLLEEVKDVIISTLDIIGNPSSIHYEGREAKKFWKSLVKMANLVNADNNSVIFTSGATEANNIVVNSFDTIIASNIEHESILNNKNILSCEL